MVSSTFYLWAKSEPRHPLWCHLIDVGAVVRVLWSEVLSPSSKSRMSRCLGVDEREAERWLVWLGALHDLGKASIDFQQMHNELCIGVEGSGLKVGTRSAKKHHGCIGAFLMKSYLNERGWLTDEALALSTAIGAHHGAINDIGACYSNPPEWKTVQDELVAFVEEAFSLVDLKRTSNAPLDPVLLNELAGLISYADWIGSAREESEFYHSEALFEGTVSIEEYTEQALIEARERIAEFGFRRTPSPKVPLEWTTLFPVMSAPRPLQVSVQSILSTTPKARMLLIEAPMGEGKTEAALYAARHWIEEFNQPGMYLGLPTQATSNAMYERVDQWLATVFGAESVESLLVHGGLIHHEYYQNKKWKTMVALSYRGQTLDDDDDLRTTAHSWFLNSKRALLAPFGTGTIDQALLGAMHAKHWFIRLAGLAGKTIIFDEIHAYDAYTSRLICRLLEFLSRLECTVILLSATLPSVKRAELLAAFSGEDQSAIPSRLEYPRITTWVPGQAIAPSVTFETSEGGKKSLQLSFSPWSLEEALQSFLATLGEKGCGAFLVNTVDEAQKAYLYLRQHHAQEIDALDLFHSRFPAAQRTEIEQRVLKLYGTGDGVTRPTGRAVLYRPRTRGGEPTDFFLKQIEIIPTPQTVLG